MPSGISSDRQSYRQISRLDPAQGLVARLSRLITIGTTPERVVMEIEVTVAEWRHFILERQIEMRLEAVRNELEMGLEAAENAAVDMERGAARQKAEAGVAAIRAALAVCQ